jgi:hypothetical protein
MAIARPIRMLAFLVLALITFLIYQVTAPRGPPLGPGDKMSGVQRDPNLDRMRFQHCEQLGFANWT